MAFIIDPQSVSFPQILQDLIDYRDSRPDADKWNTFFESGTGQTVTEKIAALGAFLAYKTISGRRENYLLHAENKSSTIGISQSLGYSTFRGRNVHLTLTVTPTVTTVLPKYTSVGVVKDQDMVVLEDTPLTANVQQEIEVVIGNLGAEELTVPSNNLAIFRFESPNVTEDYRVLLNDVEVDFSNRILDLDEDKFAAITNVLGSLDVSYLNRSSAPVQYTTGDILKIEFSTLKDTAFAAEDLNFFSGTVDSFSILTEYEDPETTDATRVNAPLFHETQALVKARQDFLKVFRFSDPDFVSTQQRDVTAATVELVYLNNDMTALTEAEKAASLDDLVKRIVMGIPPPLITDPVRVPLKLDLNVTLENNEENTLDLIDDIMAEREKLLKQSISLEDIEADVESLASVKIARVAIGSDTWTAATSLERGQHIAPTSPLSLIYELQEILYFSGSVEPSSWPTTLGDTVVDNDIVWEAELINPCDLTTTTWSSSTTYSISDTIVPTVPNGRQYRMVATINESFGNNEVQTIEFDEIPDAGTWRIHYNDGNEERTTNLAYNATALDVQNALNALECLSEVVVTGDYSTGFTVTFQGADGNKQQPQLEIEDVGFDEIQLISFDQVPNAGSFGLDFDGQITAPIPYTASATDIKTALQALSNIDLVDVSGDFTNGFEVIFKGINAKQPVIQMTQALLASSGVDEVQTISFGSVPDSGTWRLHFDGEWTQDMAYNASNIVIQTELNALSSLSGVVVTGDYSTGIVITFSGSDGKQNRVLLDANNLGQNSIQLIQFSLAPDFGTWRIDYNGQKTSYLQFNADTSDIKAALEALAGITEVTVTGDYGSGIQVEFTGVDGLQEHFLVESNDPGTDEVQNLSFSTVPDSGDFTIDFDGQITAPISATAVSSDIKAALEALSNIDEVDVSGTFASDFEVTFKGSNEKTDVVQMLINSNTLVDDQLPEEWQIDTVADSSGSLDGTTFLLYDDVGSVAFWIDVDNTGSPIPVAASAADRAIRITTVLTDETANDVAIRVQDAITNDSKFSATVSTNEVSVTSLVAGSRTDASDVDTGFSISTTQQGTSVGVTITPTTTTTGVTPDNQLLKTDNPIVVTSSETQVGLLPGNSLLTGASPVLVSEVETTLGQEPVSNLERSSVPVDVVISTELEGEVPANNLEESSGPVVITVTTVVDAADAEPTWPTSIGETVRDGDILWLGLALNGTPDTWTAATNYTIGDYVAPSTTVEDVDTTTPMMFQCIGFLGTTAALEPTFPTSVGDTVVDGNILWGARDPSVDPAQLSFKEWYEIIQNVTLTGP
jgi:hypothetical protein